MARFRIIVEEKRELDFEVEANSREEARALWENGEISVNYNEIDGSQNTTFMLIEEVKGESNE